MRRSVEEEVSASSLAAREAKAQSSAYVVLQVCGKMVSSCWACNECNQGTPLVCRHRSDALASLMGQIDKKKNMGTLVSRCGLTCLSLSLKDKLSMLMLDPIFRQTKSKMDWDSFKSENKHLDVGNKRDRCVSCWFCSRIAFCVQTSAPTSEIASAHPNLLHSHLDKVDFLKRAEERQHEQRKAAEAVERAARAALQDA